MAIIDVFTYNGEADILEIRLNVLNEYVDQFIICEAPTTFSGLSKPLYYKDHEIRFKKWWPKIKYYVIEESYSPEEIRQADESPNTVGADHWKNEFLQKESIKKALTHLKDDDVVFVGDVDEIWEPSCRNLVIPEGGFKLPLRVYTYYLNNRSTEQFWGTYLGMYGRDIKNNCLNHLRSGAYKFSPDTPDHKQKQMCGWHFTSMGGYEEVKRKLEDSYTDQSYWTPEVRRQLKERVEKSLDFLGRGFYYKVDVSEWPQYLKDNYKKYSKLLR